MASAIQLGDRRRVLPRGCSEHTRLHLGPLHHVYDQVFIRVGDVCDLVILTLRKKADSRLQP